MQKDQDIEKLFKAYQPKAGKATLMAEVERKMDVVDMVRGAHQEQIRWMTYLAVLSMVIGLAVGIGLMWLVFFHPIDWANLQTGVGLLLSPEMVLFLVKYGDMLLCLLAIASIILGALPMIFSTGGINVSAIKIRH